MLARFRALFSRTPSEAPGKRRPVANAARSYQAGKVDRLNSFWSPAAITNNTDLYTHLPMLRHRSRELSKNSDYMKKFLKLLRHNVAGFNGIRMQMRARDDNGSLDRYANSLIEAEWATHCKAGSFDVTGRLSYKKALKLLIVTMAVNGEAFVRLVDNVNRGKSRFAVQFIDPDRIPLSLNDASQNIVMGIKFDEWGAALGYYVLKATRSVLLQQSRIAVSASDCDYIPAADMLHLFLDEYEDQVRGIPWAHTAMLRLGQLNEFEKASLTGAMIGAAQAGFFTKTDVDAKPPGTEYGDGEDDGYGEGGFSLEVRPGTFTALPPGVGFQQFNPSVPNGNVAPFTKTQLQGAGNGLGLSYISISNDPAGTSYSTARTMMLDERDMFRDLQQEIIDAFCERVFVRWLSAALLRNVLGTLPLYKQSKFEAAFWLPRGFPWIDPQVETDANVTAVTNGFKTLQDVLAEAGKDFEETVLQIAYERKRLGELGISLSAVVAAAKPVATQSQQQTTGDSANAQESTDTTTASAA